MKLPEAVLEELKVSPGEPARLARREALWRPAGARRPAARSGLELESFSAHLGVAQELLFAARSHAVVVILLGLGAAGRDDAVRHVMSRLDPHGCDVVASAGTLRQVAAADFLRPYGSVLPRPGAMTILNGSYYDELVFWHVHPELAEWPEGEGEGGLGSALGERVEDVNAFERHLQRCRTEVVKCYLQVSTEEQRRRLLERLEEPERYWRFSQRDLEERARHEEYVAAYEEVLSATSTPWAPWYVVPADHPGSARALVGAIIASAIERLGLRAPPVSTERLVEIAAARATLRTEEPA